MTDIFGGGPYSRLFTNVREKESLCYYCAARYTRQKGIILVDCGIEEDNKAKAEAEILKQLQVMKNGEFEDSEFAASKMSITDSAKAVTDSMNGIDSWYSDRLFEKNPLSPEDFANIVENLNKDDIVKAANKVKLDTVYFLGGLSE
jgi:predicted Zn-dependent peptidase